MFVPHIRSLMSRSSPASPRHGRHRSRRASQRCLPRVAALEARTLLSTLTVTNDHDSGSGSLRARWPRRLPAIRSNSPTRPTGPSRFRAGRSRLRPA